MCPLLPKSAWWPQPCIFTAILNYTKAFRECSQPVILHPCHVLDTADFVVRCQPIMFRQS